MIAAASIIGTLMVIAFFCVPSVWSALGTFFFRAAILCGAVSITLNRTPGLYVRSYRRAARIAQKGSNA